MGKQVGVPALIFVGLMLSASLNTTFVRPALGICGDSVIDVGEDCDDGNTYGGDGCAQNCTNETVRDFPLDPTRTGAITQFSDQLVQLNFGGSLKFVTGRPGEDGLIPVAVPSKDAKFGRIPVPGVACACVRSLEQAASFGPGNAGVGLIRCGSGELGVSSVTVSRDHNIGVVGRCLGGEKDGQACAMLADCPGGECFGAADCGQEEGTLEPTNGTHPGVCNGPRIVGYTPGSGPRGSGGIFTNIGFDLLFDGGTCCDVGIDDGCSDPTGEKGEDGIACSDDDPGATEGIDAPGFTGPSSTAILDLNNMPGVNLGPGSMCGSDPCIAEVEGKPFDCDAILANPSARFDSGELGFAFPILDYIGFGDALVTVTLAPLPATGTCPGDCDNNNAVSIDELIRGVNIALGIASAATCSALDRDASGTVSIDELVTAVSKALNGCTSSGA
jgi:cysteine-rich repeat protein